MIHKFSILDKFLQWYRFRKALPYLKGDVLDFGGNKGELGKFIKGGGKYLVVDYDHTPLETSEVDTVVSLATIEHIYLHELVFVMRKLRNCLRPGGIMFITTPTPMAKPVLEFLARLRVIDKANIDEHKQYFNKDSLTGLAIFSGMMVLKYRRFQFGFNQYIVLKKVGY